MNPNYKFRVDQLRAADYPTAGDVRCLCIYIPSEIEHVPILAGLLALPTKQAFWFGTPEERRSRSEAWQEAYDMTDFENCFTCDSVADCIETSEAVQDALEQNIINNINNSGGVQTAIQNVIQQTVGGENPATGTGENLLLGLESCDFDHLWGASNVLIDWLNANNVDFLEKMVLASTPAAKAAELSKNIPGFAGGTAGEALATYLTFLSGGFKASYEAYYDTALANELKCGLMCLMAQNCGVTIDQLYAYFSARLGVTYLNFYDGFYFALSGALPDAKIVDAMMLIQIAAFRFMNGFLGLVGLNPLGNAIANGFNAPDDQWEADCDACPDEWCRLYDADSGLDTVFFAAGQGGEQAVWTGTGWACNPAVNAARRTIATNLGAAYNLTRIEVVRTEAITGGTDNICQLDDYPSWTVIQTLPGTATTTFELGLMPAQKFAIDDITSLLATTPAVPGELIAVYLYGYGTPPASGVACP